MLLASLAIAILPTLQPMPMDSIDAISVALPSKTATASVRGLRPDGTWTPWETLEVDDEQDPSLLESNIVMFDTGVVRMEFDGNVVARHPIRIDESPVSYKIAGIDPGTPKILSREEWGANDELLYVDTDHVAPTNDPSESTNDNGTAPASESTSKRETDCESAQQRYPSEFTTTRKTTKGENGRTLRWPYAYSKDIDLLVVHHTAVKVAGDKRSGIERVRAIYQYHSLNRGWGDVGYHYLIDEDGQIYEGKSGGKYVVGGHAYCHNVNTLGIALLGNFEDERPSQNQMKALQWLLSDLADDYSVNLDDTVTYHGQTYASPIVGHGDLLDTSCPGFYVRQTLPQVRTHVENGDLTASISFPKKPSTSSKSRSSSRSVSSQSARGRSSSLASSRPIVREGISVLGNDTLGGRPGGEVPFSVRYTTGKTGATAGQRIAEVERSDQSIGVWQFIGGEYVPVRGHIVAETSVPRNSTTSIQMKIRIPLDRGSQWITIGNARYSIQASGRAALPGEGSSSIRSTQSRSSSSRSSVSRTSSSRPRSSRSSTRSTVGERGPTIRIRLESRDKNLASCDDADLKTLRTLYRGTVECLTVEEKPTIVNTVAMEDYLMGLSEEPDTEPYEKQRAFAIAARTYAAHYMGDTYRKFPGKPYDGSDSPAIFQKYTGKAFEKNNPRWLDAVAATAHQVLTVNDEIIRPPYFSSDDGRTRSPSEVGWKSFPFIDIFTSKPDPWCDGMENRGHGVGMSGCGAEGQANEGKTGEEILEYYYPGTTLRSLTSLVR